MTSRLSAVLTAALLVLAAGAAFAIAQQVTGTAAQDQSSAQDQYRGKACGSPQRPQGTPPGNPENTDCPPQAGQGSSNRANPRRVTSRVRKRRTRRGVRLTTTGRIQLPAGMTPAVGCNGGRVQVQIKSGGRTVSTRRVALRRNCTFRSSANISRRRLGRRNLVVSAQFLGNEALSARRAGRKSLSPR